MRRTHRASELDPSLGGQKATLMGWVSSVRGHGAISFLALRDGPDTAQVVAKRGDCPDGVLEAVRSLKPHSSVGVSGTLKPSPRAPGGVELVPDAISVFTEAAKIPPFEPQSKTVKNIETRLAVRFIDLRRESLQHVFYARDRVLRAARGYLAGAGFVETHTPKLIASATEGGAALFSIFFYNRAAFLAQSPQLYKEQLTMSLDRVYEIAPIFRAEASRTQRHLSEAISIDMEEAFADYGDVMDRIEGLVGAASAAASKYASERPGSFEAPSTGKIPRYTYSELVERLRESGAKTEFGDDLYPSALRRLSLEGFYFITDWPLGPKPFYVKRHRADPGLSESFDLMFGDLEISSGSTRVAGREELEERLSAKGMDPSAFGYHLDAFDYGVPPHAGCGIGLERLMMALTGTANIRDTTLYPRDVDRLVP